MYYILNETKQIIAADDNLLSLCGVTHIDELSSKIVRGDTKLDLISDDSISIISDGEEETFTISKTTLSSMLGHLTLITVLTDTEESTSLTPIIEDEIDITLESMDDSSDLISSIINEEKGTESLLNDLDISEDESSPLELDNTDITSLLDDDNKEDKITFGDHLSIDEDSLALKDETIDNTLNDSELFDLVLDENKDDSPSIENDIPSSLIDDEPISFELKDTNLPLDSEAETSSLPEIIINVDEVSRTIGISPDDYNNFLNDFIDTALGLEKDLQSHDDDIRSDAINTLAHLSDVLHLPVMGGIIDNIADADNNDTQREVIESFYGSLSRISTTTTSGTEIETLEVTESDLNIISPTKDLEGFQAEETLELFEEPETLKAPLIQEEVKPRSSTSSESFGSLSLEGIKPKHFDFQLEEAANDLSLPVELIEEFVHDFIDQAHIETKKMLEAYEEGDLDTIQKIGHLLKGASSNLRINPLSDTLYKIQFCENAKNLDVLIKDYWAHFLSFENQINVISK